MVSMGAPLVRRIAAIRRTLAPMMVNPAARRALVSPSAIRSSTSSRSSVRSTLGLTRYTIRRSSSNPQPSTTKEIFQPGAAAVAGNEHLALAKPLDFDMASKVDGQESQMVTFELEPGQVIRAEAGNLVFMEDGIEMDTNTGGGIGSMFRRVITGQNMFVTDYVNRGNGNAKVGLGTDVPSKILRLPLADYSGSIICQRGAFLAGSHTIGIQTEFTKMMAGFFGGEGFILQRLTGEGDAFVKASGPLIQRELKEEETLRVSSGSVVAFSPSIQYDVQTLPGFKNVVFGGEGLFITVLKGPGTVFLQGLPFDRMVDQIARRIPGGRGAMGMPIPIGIGGTSGGGGSGEAAGADAGAGGEAGVAAGAEAPTLNGEGGAEAGGTSGGLFGDAAPTPQAEQASMSDSFGGADAAGGLNKPDLGFSEPPSEAGVSGEETWSEGSFGSQGGAPDASSGDGSDLGDVGDLGDMSGGEGGSTVVDTLRRLYTFFGGGDD